MMATKTLVGATLFGLFLVVTTDAAQSQSAVKPYPWNRAVAVGRCTEPGAHERITGCKPVPDWPDYVQSVQHVHLLFNDRNGDYDLVTRAEEELAFSPQRFANGAFYSDAWFAALEEIFRYTPDLSRKFILEPWKAQLGNAGTVPLAEALLEYGTAWSARGGGLATTVSPEAWKLFYSALDRALAALENASDRLRATAPYHAMRFLILLEQRGKRQESLDEFQVLNERWPAYKRPYYAAVQKAFPQWGGSFELVDSVLRSAFKNNSKEEATLIYAWVYAVLIDEDPNYTMANTKVDWPLMKRGLRILTDRDTSNLSLLTALAKSACQMRDRAEARRIYDVIDKRFKPSEREPDDLTNSCRAFATGK